MRLGLIILERQISVDGRDRYPGLLPNFPIKTFDSRGPKTDLHLDRHFTRRRDPFQDIPEEHLRGVTHCILAGDLSNKGYTQWKRCLPWIAERIPGAQIFVMPGNHDYYDGNIDREDKLRDVAAAHDATFVQKSELIFGRHRLLCCTLWTDFDIYGERSDNLRHAVTHINDYLYIRVAKTGFKKLMPLHTAQIHMDHKQWLAKRLSEPFDGETTVITHHAPHLNALKDMSDIGPCYASDLEPLILKHQPDRWLFGHTHYPVTFDIGQARLTNVSVGYPDELDPIQNLERFIFDLEE